MKIYHDPKHSLYNNDWLFLFNIINGLILDGTMRLN